MVDFNFMATGIGSVPFEEVGKTCDEIIANVPLIPFWPQFVKRSVFEDMIIQYSEGLPLLEVNEEKRSLFVSGKEDKEGALVSFYDKFLAQDVEHFAISRDYAVGLHEMLDRLSGKAGPDPAFIKGQTVGPVTFAASVTDTDGKGALHNPELVEVFTRGLAIKALWQIREMTRLKKDTILFLDEPYLSGFGSAFSPIQRHEVIEILKTIIDYLRENTDTLIGIHCCGNTDWPMVLEAGPDIVNFDAFEYLEHFLLYPKEIVSFLQSGGYVAWGIVPTSSLTGKETVEELFLQLKDGLRRVEEMGVDPALVAKRSLLTPSCGMGTMEVRGAGTALSLLGGLSGKCRKEFLGA